MRKISTLPQHDFQDLLSEKKGENGMSSMLPFVSVWKNANYIHTVFVTFKKKK